MKIFRKTLHPMKSVLAIVAQVPGGAARKEGPPGTAAGAPSRCCMLLILYSNYELLL
jgi:hypothetical protein